MDSLWMFCVMVMLWYSTELQIALAGMGSLGPESLGPESLDSWIEDSSFNAHVVESWLYSAGKKSLNTDVTPGGASWFITPSLNLPNTSYLDMEASCNNNPCQLEIYGTNQSSARVLKNYEFIQNVTFETRRIKTTTIKKSYPHLRILARATNTSSRTIFNIYLITMRHYFCENRTIYNTDLSQVDSSTTDISILVQCHDDAIASDGKSTNITVKCTPKGNWTFGDLKCVCNEGFYSSNQRCSRCPTDYHKTTIGDGKCPKCSDGKTNNVIHTQCECKEDHYAGDDENGPCYAVPSVVQDLDIQAVTSTSVNLTWSEPKDNGGFNGSLRYSVECYHCINGSKCDTIVEDAMFVPAKTKLTTTSVIVSNLVLNEKYKFKVTSMNGLRNVPTDKWKFIERIAVVQMAARTNSETKWKCEEKPSNSIVMFFAGAAVTLSIVLFILIAILIYKRRMKAATKVLPVGVEMRGQTLPEPRVRQSLNNQGYISSIGGEPTPYEEVSPPAVYAELNRSQQDATTADNTYQKLLKHESGSAIPVHGETAATYEDVENTKVPSNYQELDSTKRVLDDSASYQKLTNVQRSPPV